MVEHWSPKPGVGSSSLSTRAIVKIMADLKGYVQSSYYELKNNVTLPSYAESQRLMLVVASFVVILALIIFGVDTVFSNGIEQYFNWVK